TVEWTQASMREHNINFLAGGPRLQPDIPQPEDASLPRMKNPLVEFATLPQGPWDGTYHIGSGMMTQGEKFSVTFSAAGTYAFNCLLRGHERMAGTVEVVAS